MPTSSGSSGLFDRSASLSQISSGACGCSRVALLYFPLTQFVNEGDNAAVAVCLRGRRAIDREACPSLPIKANRRVGCAYRRVSDGKQFQHRRVLPIQRWFALGGDGGAGAPGLSTRRPKTAQFHDWKICQASVNVAPVTSPPVHQSTLLSGGAQAPSGAAPPCR
jgi:hypothetical protein